MAPFGSQAAPDVRVFDFTNKGPQRLVPMSYTTAALILAAGQGTRMQSSLPKVLHEICGLPLICHVVRRAKTLGCSPVVVVVSPQTRPHVEKALASHFGQGEVTFALQAQPQGTGDAVRAGLTALTAEQASHVVILYGDVPLLTDPTLAQLADAGRKTSLAFLTAKVADPTGYGRVLRNGAGEVTRIVEHKDASESERRVTEVNAGVYFVEQALLRTAISGLNSNNAQNELYLTDVVAHAATLGGAQAVNVENVNEIRGVNSRVELAMAEKLLRFALIRHHQLAGVTFVDEQQVVIGVDVVLGRDVTVGAGVQLMGKTAIGNNVRIEGPSVLRDAIVLEGAVIHAFSHLDQAHVGLSAQVGPYARLRPKAELRARARVGNFVEIKNATLEEGAKVNHLSYVGDAHVGENANVGAGTITCNYDGFRKSRTQIGARAFVGSNSTLIAPLNVGDGAFVAAGSTLTEDVPADALAFGRARQSNREGGARALREKLAASSAAPAQGHQGEH